MGAQQEEASGYRLIANRRQQDHRRQGALNEAYANKNKLQWGPTTEGCSKKGLRQHGKARALVSTNQGLCQQVQKVLSVASREALTLVTSDWSPVTGDSDDSDYSDDSDSSDDSDDSDDTADLPAHVVVTATQWELLASGGGHPAGEKKQQLEDRNETIALWGHLVIRHNHGKFIGPSNKNFHLWKVKKSDSS